MSKTHTHYNQHTAYKEAIRKRDNFTCQLCGKEGWQVDHIIPYAISHDSSPKNLRVLCHACNLKLRRPRRDRALPEAEYAAWLKSQLSH